MEHTFLLYGESEIAGIFKSRNENGFRNFTTALRKTTTARLGHLFVVSRMKLRIRIRNLLRDGANLLCFKSTNRTGNRVSTGSGSDLVQPSASKILREYCMPITDQVATAPCTDPIHTMECILLKRLAKREVRHYVYLPDE